MFKFKDNYYEQITPQFESNNVPIFMSVSNEFTPYFSVLLSSIINCSSEEMNYDVIVFHRGDISKKNQKSLVSMIESKRNFSLRFCDVAELVEGWNPYLRGHVTVLTYFRFIAPYIMNEYEYAIYMDGDTIAVEDLSELMEVDLEDNYLGAVIDAAAAGIYADGRNEVVVNSFNNILKLRHPENYFQAGVLLVNLRKFREDFTLEYLMEICEKGPWYFVDQDVLNTLCQDKVTFIDMNWNVESYASLEVPLKFAPNEVKLQYEKARKEPKVIHYAGKIKPWNVPDVDFGEYFWKAAVGSPFYINILEKLAGQVRPKEIVEVKKRFAVIRCVTVYHLFNAINLKLTELLDDEVVLILSNDTIWGDIVSKVEATGIFNKVVVSNMTKIYIKMAQMSSEERFKATLKPRTHLIEAGAIREVDLIDSMPQITDFYVALEYSMERFLYYYMCELGHKVNVHHFEEGTASYVIDYFTRIKNDGMLHERHGDKSYLKAIKELLLYEPALFVGKKGTWDINKLPPITPNDDVIKKIMYQVFGEPVIPKEKYIFLESPIVAEQQISVDIDLLDSIADIVGKNNIIVKLHPRNPRNRFAIRGYKTMPMDCSLWEINNYAERYGNKIFISEISTATLTSKTIFGNKIYSINLYQLLKLCNSFFVEQPQFPAFYKKFDEYMNHDERRTFSPRSLDELKEIILFLEGRVRNE